MNMNHSLLNIKCLVPIVRCIITLKLMINDNDLIRIMIKNFNLVKLLF